MRPACPDINLAEMNDGLSFPRHMPLLTMNPCERLVKSSAWVGSLFDTTDSQLYLAAAACAVAVASSRRRWLEAEDERNRTTRLKLCKEILEPYMAEGATVLDIGCGGGYLAKAVSSKAGKVFASDISLGVIECAKILNSSPNIEFVHSSPPGWQTIPDGSIDLAYSVAVIQHVRSSVIHYLFDILSKKLKSGGQAYLIVQLEGDEWREEEEWVRDQSLMGRLRSKYALNFFPRTEQYFRDLCNSVGLDYCSVKPASDILSSKYDDVYQQHLLHVGKT